MINKIILLIISVGDFFHKRKIIKFLKKKNLKNLDCLVDVGAHKGESVFFFLKYFKIQNIYSFEPIKDNLDQLKSKLKLLMKKYPNCSFVLENKALGSSSKKLLIKKMVESSSSTIRELNLNSKYLNKKKKLLYSGKQNFFENIEVEQITLDSYLENKVIRKIDFLKIDTEGYELEVLMGLNKNINKLGIVMFEHHYHDMIKKNYTFTDIHKFLTNHNFKKIYKSKMPFRKTFEYIYEKEK